MILELGKISHVPTCNGLLEYKALHSSSQLYIDLQRCTGLTFIEAVQVEL